MVEKDPTCGGQLDASSTANHQLSADLVLKVPDLTPEGRLRRVQPLLSGHRETTLLGDSNEIPEMPQLHNVSHASEVWHQPTKYTRVALPERSQQHQKACERLHSAALRASQIERSDDMGTPVVLITGALTGIGRAAARAFAGEGHRIVVAGRHEPPGHELAAELRALGTEVEFLRADVRQEDDVRNLIDRTVARFGRLDAAVNSAGTEGQPGPVTQQTADTYTATFDTNVLGTLLSMKHELRVMQALGVRVN